MSTKSAVPWHDPAASDWFNKLEAWRRFQGLVVQTLESDPRKYPNQIRAATAVVILLVRDGLWQTRPGAASREQVLALAKRQLAQIKQMYSIESRGNPELLGNPSYKKLMQTLDEEMRLLEARMNGEEINLADEAPSSWGDFWNVALKTLR